MTTEDDFQKALDANPDDHQTRLVFADWLQERDDPRAEGYRALGVLRRVPVPGPPRWNSPGYCSLGVAAEWRVQADSHDLPELKASRRLSASDCEAAKLFDDWLFAIPDGEHSGPEWKVRDTRREVEDAAAVAFAKLPTKRRAALLATPAEPAI